MSIEALTTIQWSKFNWDKSWSSLVDIEDLLPEVGVSYALVADEATKRMRDGPAAILWKPPHSELNGWHDGRPFEILKTFVVFGQLKNRRGEKEAFDFLVEHRRKLTDVFESEHEDILSPLSDLCTIPGNSTILWQDAEYLRCAVVGKYTYLCGSAIYTDMELILSFQNGQLCIHYASYKPQHGGYDSWVTKHYPGKLERSVLRSLLEKAEVIIENTKSKVPDGRVAGADYM